MTGYRRYGQTSDHLTYRELEVLGLLSQGHTHASAGAILFVSPETVKSHMRTIFAKLDAKNRTHAVAIAIREGHLA